jgi:hypothetical protein
MWNFLFDFLFGWWWWGADGRTKTADAAGSVVLPLLLVLSVICLVVLIFWVR